MSRAITADDRGRMSPAGYAWRMAVSLLAVLSMFPLLIPDLFSTLPFDLEPRAGIGYVVTEVPGMSLSSGLRPNDVVDLDATDPDARAAAIYDNNLRNGVTYTLVVRRGDARVNVPVTTQVNTSAFATYGRITEYPLLLGVLALGLLTLWRGRDWTAWGLTLFALGICSQQLFEFWPTDALTSLWCYLVARMVTWSVTIPGLYIAVESLAGAALSAGMRRAFRVVFAALVLATIASSIGKTIGVVFYAWTSWIAHPRLMTLPGVLMVLTPLALLLAAYRRNDAARRLRIRWVLWSTGLLGASVVINVFVTSANIAGHVVIAALQGLCMFGYIYAVLRHRLVDIAFIVDRALVYGLMTSLVIGVFAILENFIEQAAVGNDASFLLQAGATLVLALALNRVHRRVETLVDRLFFSRQRRASYELRRFSQQSAFIEQHERLLSLTVDTIERSVGGSGVAIYERRDGRYLRLIQRGDTQYPTSVEVDDVAFVSLRSTLQPADLDAQLESAFGSDGTLFPMALRGVLLGAIVCGGRRGEQFAPDERAELARLAQEVGIALYVLRAREHEKFVAAVANGAVADPQAGAKQLLPTLAAYRGEMGLG